MALTPEDIENKTFGTALRGYDLDEVDDFLDEIVSTMRGLHDQVAVARTATPAPVAAEPVGDEGAVGRALIAAQTMADQILAEAKDESEKLLDDAKGEADSWAAERDAKRVEADAEMNELGQHVASVRTQLAVLATAVADRLDEMDESLTGSDADEADDGYDEDDNHVVTGDSDATEDEDSADDFDEDSDEDSDENSAETYDLQEDDGDDS